MPRQEDEHHRFRPSESEPLYPVSLPPELADFLRGQDTACVTQATDRGAVYVVKAPAREIVSVGGVIPVRLQHALYQHSHAPVIRTVIGLYDQPERPLQLETFCNVAAADQQADFASLAAQEELLLLFYDEALSHRLSKRVRNPDPAGMRRILAVAARLRDQIPRGQYDFDQAKAAVIRATPL